MTPATDASRAIQSGRTAGRQLLDLSGTWRVQALNSNLLRAGADPELDDSTWAALAVPGHWADSLDFADNDGPLLYRRRFSTPVDDVDPAGSRRSRFWLRMDGVMSEAEVWMDGQYLGATVGYFATHQFEVTSLLAARTEHVLAVDVRCNPPEPNRTMATATDDGPRDKTALTGALQVGPLAPPTNPGGIWGPVAIDATGPVSIVHGRVLCTEATADQATVSIRAVLDSSEAVEGQLRATITPIGPDRDTTGTGSQVHVRPQPLAKGENRIEWSIPIENPQLWWPAELGNQPLYEVSISIETVEGQHSVSDEMTWTTGLRTVSMDDMVWTINGQRLFLKTVAYGPTHPFQGSVGVPDLQADVDTAIQAGFNTIRPVGHIARRELLHLADLAGMMVWQDLPLIGGYSSKTQRAVKSLIREAVDVVGHHPSVVVWGGHCQPNGEAVARPSGDSVAHPARQIIRHVLPSWNRSFLDSIVGRELEAADPTRPTVARSGHLPSRLDQPNDSRLWLGWRMGRSDDACDLFDRWPRLAMFPAGIGAQSLSFPHAAQDDEWVTAEFDSLTRYVNPRDFDNFESWAQATERYQAELLQRQVETIRRRKFKPSGGYCLTALADTEPWGGFGLVRFDRSAKPALFAVAAANRPVMPVIAEPPTTWPPNRTVSLEVQILSDLFYGLDTVEVQATISSADGAVLVSENWEQAVAADGVTAVGSATFQTPSRGQVDIVLSMTEGGSTEENRYTVAVVTG